MFDIQSCHYLWNKLPEHYESVPRLVTIAISITEVPHKVVLSCMSPASREAQWCTGLPWLHSSIPSAHGPMYKWSRGYDYSSLSNFILLDKTDIWMLLIRVHWNPLNSWRQHKDKWMVIWNCWTSLWTYFHMLVLQFPLPKWPKTTFGAIHFGEREREREDR